MESLSVTLSPPRNEGLDGAQMTAARADDTFRRHLRDPVEVLDVAHETAAGACVRCNSSL